MAKKKTVADPYGAVPLARRERIKIAPPRDFPKPSKAKKKKA